MLSPLLQLSAGAPITPTGSEALRTTRLTRQVDMVHGMLEGHRESWAMYGCTIISDGWKDVRKRYLLNVLVSCCTGTTFLRAIDMSGVGIRITESGGPISWLPKQVNHRQIVVEAADVSQLQPHTAEDDVYDFIREDKMRFTRHTRSRTHRLREEIAAVSTSARPQRGGRAGKPRRSVAELTSTSRRLTPTPSECESEESCQSEGSE
ncbi:hypothetical protein L7F22_050923 [Adiantum nelumboides]|nr:hypothetical protein [Adiantum nelumboides]